MTIIRPIPFCSSTPHIPAFTPERVYFAIQDARERGQLVE